MVNVRLQVAIVGVGRMGRRWAKVISDQSDSSVKYLVDFDLEAAKTAAAGLAGGSISVTNNLDEVLADASVGAIVVATPHKFLSEITEKALRAGKHVLCEKPGGIHAEEIQRGIDTAKSRNLRYMVAFNHRTHPALWQAHELVLHGDIGKILFIRGRYGHGGRKDYDKEWRAQKKLSGGGELLDQGIHLVDLSLWFLGDLEVAGSALTTSFWPVAPLEDNAFLILKNREKQVAFLHASWTQWQQLFSFEIFGERGYLIVEGLGGGYGPETLIIGKRDEEFRVKEERQIFQNPRRIDPDDALYALWNEFMSAIQEKREPSPSAADAVRALRIIEDVYRQRNPNI